MSQLLGQADEARSHKDRNKAMKFENEAESLAVEVEHQIEVSDARILKDIKPRKKPDVSQAKKLFPKAKALPKPPPKPVQKSTDLLAHMEREEEENDVKRWSNPDRARLIGVVAGMPQFNPLTSVGKQKGDGSVANEVTQFGLCTAGCSLLALEPATGGILLLFSGVFQAVTSEAEEEPEPGKAREEQEPEKVEENQKAGLFVADQSAIKWLIA